MANKSKYESIVKPHLEEIRNAVQSGATVEEVADAFGIARSTLYNYQSKYKELEDAFARGRDMVIFDIKGALLKKALGFYYNEERTIAKKDKEGKNVASIEKFKRYCPPSETAAGMLLRNYDKTWRDNDETTAKIRQQEHELRKAIAEASNIDLEV